MKSKLNWLEAVLLIAPFVALVVYWNELPASIPVHWNLYGKIDGWGAKPFAILMLPLLGLGVVILLHLLPAFDPKLRGAAPESGGMNSVLPIFRLALAFFFAAIFALQLAASLGQRIAAGRLIMACTLVLLAIVGNYLGNLRPNYFAGIRTPWTLESPATWRATHRLGGRLMFFGAIILLVLEFILNQDAFGFVFLTLILALVIWAFAYSWHHFRTHAATR